MISRNHSMEISTNGKKGARVDWKASLDQLDSQILKKDLVTEGIHLR